MRIRRDVFRQAPDKLSLGHEIKVWGPRVIATILWEIGSRFELETGHQLDVTSDLPERYIAWMNAGATFDVFVGVPSGIDEFIKRGKINPETCATLARASIGVGIQAGAHKPDIGTVPAFKRTLFDATSIAYLNIGGGVYVQEMLERLGIYEAIKAKITRPDMDVVSDLVAKGDVEIGIVNVSQILTTHGVQLVGALPAELQSHVVFVAGVSSESGMPGAAQELIRFLREPCAASVIEAQGLEMCT